MLVGVLFLNTVCNHVLSSVVHFRACTAVNSTLLHNYAINNLLT